MAGAFRPTSFCSSTSHHGLNTAPEGDFFSRRKNFSIDWRDIIYLTAKMNSQPSLRVFLCGDVMTGRGIDQALPRSVDPILYEPQVRDARDYVDLCAKTHGTLQPPVRF